MALIKKNLDLKMPMKIKLFNEKLKELKSIYKNESKFDEAINLALEIHSLVHSSSISNSDFTTYEDDLWNGLDDETARKAVNKKGRTIVYGIWHSSRIEDITANILIDDSPQVFNDEWKNKINSSVSDTGNQFSDKEILKFSENINVFELKNYRNAVAIKTRSILENLEFSDFKRKFSRESLERIFMEKAVARHADSEWLVDFWGKKDVAGIIFMPLTRHNLVHINESNQAKNSGQ